MLATQLSPATRSSLSTTQRREKTPPAITSHEVKEMLLEIAFNLHATRVVKKMKRTAAPKPTDTEV